MTMVSHELSRSDAGRRPRQGDRLQLKALFWLTYPFFLALVVISRLMPERHRLIAQPRDARTNVFAEARAAAHASLPYAFMG